MISFRDLPADDLDSPDSDAVRATQAFGVIGVIIMIPIIIICVLSELKGCMSSPVAFIETIGHIRDSKRFIFAPIAACVCMILSCLIWLDVNSDFNDSDLGFSWALMLLGGITIAMLAFYPHIDPKIWKNADEEYNSAAGIKDIKDTKTKKVKPAENQDEEGSDKKEELTDAAAKKSDTAEQVTVKSADKDEVNDAKAEKVGDIEEDAEGKKEDVNDAKAEKTEEAEDHVENTWNNATAT